MTIAETPRREVDVDKQRIFGVVGLVCALGLAGCATGTDTISEGDGTTTACDAPLIEASKAIGRAAATLDALDASAERERLEQERQALAGFAHRACNASDGAESQRLQVCLLRAQDAASSLAAALELLEPDDRATLEWVVAARLDALHDATLCEPPGAITLDSVRVDASSTRGFEPVHGVHLELRGDPTSTLSVEAHLVCERQTSPGQWERVEDCDQVPLRPDDRFQVRFRPSADAWLYLLMFNGTGQFQTLFPDLEAPNQVAAGTWYVLPAEDDWWALDDTTDVLEHLQLVAATGRVAELENLRAADFPGNGGRPPPVAERTRGKMEPIICRGVRVKGKKVRLNPAGQIGPIDRPVEGKGVVAVEFTIPHVR